MLKILVKKQLAEIFRMYLYNAKKNKARSRKSTILLFVMFAAVMIGVLGGMFGGMAWVMRSLIGMDLGWFYYLLFTIIAIVLGAFGSIFNTYSGLYLAKDNDLLLCMPIPVNTLMASRLVSVYLMGLMYSAVVTVPAAIMYIITAGPSVANIIGAIVWLLVVSIIVMVLSCLLGYVVARLSLKMKHKNFTTVALTIVLIGLYYFFYFKASEMMRSIITNAVQYGEKMKNSMYLMYRFGCAPTGDWVAMAVSFVIAAVLLAAVWGVMARSFLKIATATGKTAHVTYKERTARQRSPFAAMLGKEFARFTGSANYMLNCGLGILMLVLMGGFILVKGGMVSGILQDVFGSYVDGALPVLICGILILVASMNDMIAPSVALEGKNIWIAHSLPVSAKTALRAKLAMHLILTLVPLLLCILCVAVSFRLPAAELALAALDACLFVVLSALFGLFMGMLNPNLKWTNELYPIKQSISVLITMMAGWVCGIGIILLYLLVAIEFLSAAAYLLIWAGVYVLLIGILTVWFERRAPGKFADL